MSKINYNSKEKLYKINKKHYIFNNVYICYLLVAVSFIFLLASIYLISSSVVLFGKKIDVTYNEIGKADYTVYLNNNNYYNSNYLESGMKYIGSLINTVNTRFNYQFYTDKNIDFSYKYKINGELVIYDKNDESKVFYTKDEELVGEIVDNINSNNIVINQSADVDYDKYNKYVESYKKDYGVDVSGKVIVTMNVELLGIDEESKSNITKNNDLQITIPLTKNATEISIDTNNIDNEDYLVSDLRPGISNLYLLILGVICFVAAIIEFVYGEKLYKIYVKGNIYNITVNRILREYDKLIVNGDVSIDENQFTNKIYPETFIELVDASERLNSPILFYEVVPNEKCFFIIIKDRDLYKFRISKSFLEKEEVERNLDNMSDVKYTLNHILKNGKKIKIDDK
jgi:hypothetical protein